MIHRDYMSPVDTQVKIFDNKITFYNPGSLYGGLTLFELKSDDYQAQARNKLIAEAFYLTGDIEKYGSGFLRVRNEISTYPTMKFDFEEKATGFLVTLSYTEQKTSTELPNVSDDVSDDVSDRFTSNQLKILSAMRSNSRVTYSELAEIVGIAPTNIARNIKKLTDNNIIRRIGSTKRGYWEIIV